MADYREIMQSLVDGIMYGENAAKVMGVADVIVSHVDKAVEEARAIKMDGTEVRITHDLMVAIVRSQPNILSLITSGKKIEAIKELRKITGADLATSKKAVDAIM